MFSSISYTSLEWLAEIKASYQHDEKVQAVMEQLTLGQTPLKGYSLKDGLLLRKGRILVVNNYAIKEKILDYLHSSPMGSYSGYLRTYQRAKEDFYWQGMKNYNGWYINDCDVCVKNIHPVGLL